jgi:hypothetical protein
MIVCWYIMRSSISNDSLWNNHMLFDIETMKPGLRVHIATVGFQVTSVKSKSFKAGLCGQ